MADLQVTRPLEKICSLKATHLRPLVEYGRQTIRLSKHKRKGHRTWYRETLTPQNLGAAVEHARELLKVEPDT